MHLCRRSQSHPAHQHLPPRFPNHPPCKTLSFLNLTMSKHLRTPAARMPTRQSRSNTTRHLTYSAALTSQMVCQTTTTRTWWSPTSQPCSPTASPTVFMPAPTRSISSNSGTRTTKEGTCRAARVFLGTIKWRRAIPRILRIAGSRMARQMDTNVIHVYQRKSWHDGKAGGAFFWTFFLQDLGYSHSAA